MKKKKLTPQERKRLVKERSFKIYFKVGAFLVVFILLANLLNIIIKDKPYSETENRMMAQFPKFSVQSLMSGDYMTDMEDYVTDQFVARNAWIRLKLFEDMALGKRESNGVYIGRDGYLQEMLSEPNEEQLSKNLDAIRSFASKNRNIHTVMAVVPNAAYICDQNRPIMAPCVDQGKYLEDIKETLGNSLSFVDLVETMKAHKNEEIYYRTDHHWTSLGARYAFEAMAEDLRINQPVTEYTIYPVTHTFKGTLASKSGYNKSKDTIELFIPDVQNNNYVVNYVDEGEKSSSMYVSEALDQKDQYEVFFGGNHTRVDVMTTFSESRNLLILKDSYANCFIQFLTPYYSTITIVDPRYYYDDLNMLIRDNNITDMLYLYNVNTFITDTSLADVLEAE